MPCSGWWIEPGPTVQNYNGGFGVVESEPVSSGRAMMANVVGFFVGGFVGIPIGLLVGSLIHLPGRGPTYLGLVIGSFIWTGVANAIKSSG